MSTCCTVHNGTDFVTVRFKQLIHRFWHDLEKSGQSSSLIEWHTEAPVEEAFAGETETSGASTLQTEHFLRVVFEVAKSNRTLSVAVLL